MTFLSVFLSLIVSVAAIFLILKFYGFLLSKLEDKEEDEDE